MSLGQGRAALELECEAKLLKPVEAMHDPVVFFDEGWINALFFRHNPDQVRELRMVVEEITRHEVRPVLTRDRRISSYARCRIRARRGASGDGQTTQLAAQPA